jgi:hypothetical protein
LEKELKNYRKRIVLDCCNIFPDREYLAEAIKMQLKSPEEDYLFLTTESEYVHPRCPNPLCGNGLSKANLLSLFPHLSKHINDCYDRLDEEKVTHYIDFLRNS